MILRLNIEADKLNSDLIYTAGVGMIHGRHIMGSNFSNLAREVRFADLIVS